MEKSLIEHVAEYYPDVYRNQLEGFLSACQGDSPTVDGARDLETAPLNTHDFDTHTGQLGTILEEDRDMFLCFLALEVLIDEVIYTHFSADYPLFRESTMYPKLSFCGHGNITRDPWSVLRYRERGRKGLIDDRNATAAVIARFLSCQP